MVYATSAEDISAAILFSRAHSIDVAVYGGGHSSNGSSSTNGGLVFDLRKMRKVTVDPERQTVLAQGGTIWEDIDIAAAEFGLAVVGGTVNHTGVGGLTLGGGYGWLTGRHGLTIDSLLEVTMVLADGSIKKASACENSDLFWAVRGAGQSFGVVVELTFQAHEQKSPVWAGSLYFPAKSKLEAVVEFANHLMEVTDGNSAMGIVLNWPPFMPELTAVAVVFYNGSKDEATKLFAPLLELNPVKDTTAERPYSEVNSLLNKGTEHGSRRTAKGACYVTPLGPTFVRSLLEELEQLYHEIPDAKKSTIVFEFYDTEQSSKIAPTATAFANRGQHQNAMASPGWTDPANDEACCSWAGKVAQRFAEELERVKKERGNPASMDKITEYGNYGGEQGENPDMAMATYI